LEASGVIELDLPYPPTVNTYYRHVGFSTLISREGREYRRRVESLCLACGVRSLAGPLAVALDVHPPDGRRRDADNVQKPILDALQHGGAYGDDSQVKDLHTIMRDELPGGRVFVRIRPL
jgi:crossover junction endodeoxyribonuclease RusA